MKGCKKVLVSACLLGIRCRYDGGRLPPLPRNPEEVWIPVCPEQLGGLPTPRSPARIMGGDGEAVLEGKARVMNETGEDVTDRFLLGAEEVLRIAQALRVGKAILKERSPSCGVRWTHNGEGLVEGMGVTAALLHREGILLVSDEELRGSPPDARS